MTKAARREFDFLEKAGLVLLALQVAIFAKLWTDLGFDRATDNFPILIMCTAMVIAGQRRLAGRLKAKLRAVEKAINTLVPGSKNWSVYEKHRFGAVERAEVEQRVARFGTLLNRFGAIRVRTLTDGVFEIGT